MANLALGIDTGGTFTDGVILDLDNRKILKKTKEITTRHDLTVAVDNCLNNLLNEDEEIKLDDIKMVSLSTTLATNAIVEGQGAEVGLILIGFDATEDLPTPHYISIAGGCNIKGKIKEKVDLKAAKKGIESMESKVDAFAVSGYLSIRNPEQEIKVRNLIRKLTAYPVVAAHQLTSELGMHERTVTAVFNARLMPLITDLIGAVKENLNERGIEAPLMVVKGDGSLISEKMAREKPVETSLSGPAASIIGSMTLTGEKDGIIVDMGGTTTDVAILKNGKPNLTVKGAKVGGWLTRVQAADITTEGVGGDSFIQVSKDRILNVGPQRVFPLSWATSNYPYLYEELKTIYDKNYFPINSQPTNILVYIKDPVNFDLTDTEKNILKILRKEPHSLYYIARKLDRAVDILPWKRLVNSGSLHRASLTPTDILHIEGKFTKWNEEATKLGAKIMARRYNTDLDSFIKDVLEEIYFKVASLLIEVLLKEKGIEITCKDNSLNYLFREMLKIDKEKNNLLEFYMKTNMPIIAVGAPVNAYFPQIAKKMNAKLFLPEHAEVANAVGTVSGKVIERIKIIIKPGVGGGFIVHMPSKRISFIKFDEAIDYALKNGEKLARQLAIDCGATNIEIMTERKDKYSEYGGQTGVEKDEDKLFIESIIQFSAVGKPWDED